MRNAQLVSLGVSQMGPLTTPCVSESLLPVWSQANLGLDGGVYKMSK